VSLYNALFGVNTLAPLLLNVLGLVTKPDAHAAARGLVYVGRFRDCYLGPEGKTITLYTRNGGGNRNCWDLEGCKDGAHDTSCLVAVNAALAAHPKYISDADDDFDCTYASFTFGVPDAVADLLHSLAQGESKGQPQGAAKFRDLMARMEKADQADPVVKRALEVMGPVLKKINDTLEGGGGTVVV